MKKSNHEPNRYIKLLTNPYIQVNNQLFSSRKTLAWKLGCRQKILDKNIWFTQNKQFKIDLPFSLPVAGDLNKPDFLNAKDGVFGETRLK